jgi:hypothetical protein
MSKSERSFRVGLIALGVVVLGLVLLVGVPIVDAIVGVAQRLPLPVLLGLGAVVGGGLFIGWRTRERFLNSPRWRATVCPRCGGPLQREHRSSLDRVVSKVWLTHGRRYRCAKAGCGWTGLRNSRGHATAIDEQ